jgi:hypothetical protein
LPGNETTRIRISMKKSKKLFCFSENMSIFELRDLSNTYDYKSLFHHNTGWVNPKGFTFNFTFLESRNAQPLFDFTKMRDSRQLQQLILLSLLLTIKMVCNGF